MTSFYRLCQVSFIVSLALECSKLYSIPVSEKTYAFTYVKDQEFMLGSDTVPGKTWFVLHIVSVLWLEWLFFKYIRNRTFNVLTPPRLIHNINTHLGILGLMSLYHVIVYSNLQHPFPSFRAVTSWAVTVYLWMKSNNDTILKVLWLWFTLPLTLTFVSAFIFGIK